ncbi:MAG TPA: DUF4032 domain-containing protein [Elusimicrobiota bacterium]|nr:DUF4032 domain-containing protein [Elusimicrobiota bacterium]
MPAQELHIRPGFPDFLDLPWDRPLGRWDGDCKRLVEVQRGPSRHEVRFVEYSGRIFAVKELPDPRLAEREYENLRALAEKKLPTVEPVGHVLLRRPEGDCSSLVTLYLESSLPYRALFSQPGMARYWERLWDALAALLVRLHLAGFYWGDCSLANVLLKRQGGELAAHVVDVETSSVHESLTDAQREQDLSIMEENVYGSLLDLVAESGAKLPQPPDSIARAIRERYERLWQEINREILISKDERYKIHERIEQLNRLGFSVDEVALAETGAQGKLSMRALVTDQSYHRHQLHSLTGIAAGDHEARQLFNEIQTLRASLSRDMNRSIPLSSAAFRWLTEVFHPAMTKLNVQARPGEDMATLYCRILEHKWYLSEKAGRDVGLERAVEDYNRQFGKP